MALAQSLPFISWSSPTLSMGPPSPDMLLPWLWVLSMPAHISASLRLQPSQPCMIWASPASAACSPPLCSMPCARIESWHLDACKSGRTHAQVMLTHHRIWRPCTAADLSLRSRRAPGCCCGACWRTPSAGSPPLRGSGAPGGAPVCAAAAPATASCAHSRSGSAPAPAQHQTQLWPPPHAVMQGPLNSIQTRINGDC